MKETYKILIIGSILCFVLLSCEKEPEGYQELLISFSNGIVLDQDDIVFYDSSECIFLIKDTLNFKYYSDTHTGPDYVDFSFSLDNDTIYKGLVFLGESSLTPSAPIYIANHESGKYFDSNILDLKYNKHYDPTHSDERNNSRIISFLEQNGMLRHGITVTLDSVRRSPDNDSSLTTTITISNHDKVNYYLPDPFIMGSMHFSFFIGGLSLAYQEPGNSSYHPYVDYSISNLYDHQMENLSILNANSNVTHTYTAMYPVPFKNGLYTGSFRFAVLRRLTHMEIPLEQDDGWVWVGDKFFRFEDLLIE